MIAATTLRGRLAARRHTALLGAIVAFFVLRGLLGDGSGGSRVAFSLALLALLVVALFTMEVDELVGERTTLVVQRRRRRAVLLTLGALAVVERVGMVAYRTPALELAGTLGWLVFFCFITWAQLQATLRQRTVTGETISMATSVYLLIGLTWGILFAVIHQLQPGAFAFSTSAADGSASAEEFFPTFIYFSLTTLSTVGYGDITPVSLQARFAAVAEAIVGQLYLTILVARLVGLHMAGGETRSDGR